MSIERDILEEKYGGLISAFDQLEETTTNQVKQQFTQQIQKLESDKSTLEEMLLNVCRKAYMLKAGLINPDQLISVVNGCLDPKVIDRFTWDYLMKGSEKEKVINKDIQNITENYIEESKDLMIYADEIDLEESPDYTQPLYPSTTKQFCYAGLSQKDLQDAFNEDSDGCLSAEEIEKAIEDGSLDNNYNHSDELKGIARLTVYELKTQFGLSDSEIKELMDKQRLAQIEFEIKNLIKKCISNK